MSHLHPERLAALADSEPTAAESAHLSSCSLCAREIAAHRRLLMLAWQEREALSAPLLSWEPVAEAARDGGLLQGEPAGGADARRVSGLRSPWWLQAAAAVALLVGGGVIGVSVGRQPLSATGDAGTMASSGTRTDRMASASDTVVTFGSAAEALSVATRAEREYRMAMMYLAGEDAVTRTPEDPEIYRARLAALDEMVGVALNAVREAPGDPMMNRYYLSTLGARDATLRELGDKLPENVQLVGF
ncbi:MAG: hypothetical protein ACT4PJ_18035 [Gemmatimonadaceae bacterium]